jgi:hypothetical protein
MGTESAALVMESPTFVTGRESPALVTGRESPALVTGTR